MGESERRVRSTMSAKLLRHCVQFLLFSGGNRIVHNLNLNLSEKFAAAI